MNTCVVLDPYTQTHNRVLVFDPYSFAVHRYDLVSAAVVDWARCYFQAVLGIRLVTHIELLDIWHEVKGADHTSRFQVGTWGFTRNNVIGVRGQLPRWERDKQILSETQKLKAVVFVSLPVDIDYVNLICRIVVLPGRKETNTY